MFLTEVQFLKADTQFRSGGVKYYSTKSLSFFFFKHFFCIVSLYGFLDVSEPNLGL